MSVKSSQMFYVQFKNLEDFFKFLKVNGSRVELPVFCYDSNTSFLDDFGGLKVHTVVENLMLYHRIPYTTSSSTKTKAKIKEDTLKMVMDMALSYSGIVIVQGKIALLKSIYP